MLKVTLPCVSVYLPQPQTAQALTNLCIRFHTWPRRSAAPAQADALQDSTERKGKKE